MRPGKPTLLLLIVSAFSFSAASADIIAIIGTGNVATALGPEFAAQGHTIIYGSRQPDSDKAQELAAQTGRGATVSTPFAAADKADIVVLAVPGMLAGEIVKGLGALSGKIIIDPTNPMERRAMTFHHGVENSNAEIIQSLVPDARVVKAFNTLSWKTMINPEEADGPVSVPLAGNNGGAKEFVADLVEKMGLEAVDVGGVENAHWLEGMAILLLNNRFGDRDNFDFHLRKID